MARRVYAVGVGPGSPEYVTAKVAGLIRKATVVAGFQHSLKAVADLTRGKKVIPIPYKDQEATYRHIRDDLRSDDICVFTATGDPMFSDSEYLERLSRNFGIIEIIPGISSIQVAAAKANIPLEDIVLITFHVSGDIEEKKRKLLEAVRGGERVILLPRPWDFMPNEIARWLIINGVDGEKQCIIFEFLTLSNEKVTKSSLKDLMGLTFSDLSVMVMK